MGPLKSTFTAMIAMCLANTISAMIAMENDRGYSPKYDGDNFYIDDNPFTNKDFRTRLIQFWLAYLNEMRTPNLRNSEFRQGNAYYAPEMTDSPADADEFGDFEKRNQPSQRGQPKRLSVSEKRFGGDGGIFERFRTNLYAGRAEKQAANSAASENGPIDQNQVGNENNNVNDGFFWKEKLLPPGILQIMSRN